MACNMRIGHGYDVHRFAERFQPAKPLVLAGVQLPVEMSLLAHSDGDLVIHALADAVLGATGKGDIGAHFPDSDQSLAGMNSAGILRRALALALETGYKPVNVDVTVVAQAPKLAPFIQEMRRHLASLCGLAADAVNLKATTTEGLGFIGREEGMACYAVVLMQGDA